MARQKCIYCNIGTLLHIQTSSDCNNSSADSQEPSSPSFSMYQCDACGVQCTQLELNSPNSRHAPYSAFHETERSEEELLVQAWELMQKREWKDALNVLLSPQSPLKHPAEFLICRDICQIAPLILRGQSAQRDSHAKLTMLLNNLSCLDYYIAADGDNETAFSTLNRLFAALMLLGSLPIKRLAVYAPNFPKYYTNDYVASALCNFAVYLETFSLDKENFALLERDPDTKFIWKHFP